MKRDDIWWYCGNPPTIGNMQEAMESFVNENVVQAMKEFFAEASLDIDTFGRYPKICMSIGPEYQLTKGRRLKEMVEEFSISIGLDKDSSPEEVLRANQLINELEKCAKHLRACLTRESWNARCTTCMTWAEIEVMAKDKTGNFFHKRCLPKQDSP